MRLTCPNCGAQYEVPPEAVPAAGRDVQCSACGHTWFEIPGGTAAAPPAAEEDEPWDRVPRVADDDEEADDIEEVRVAPPPIPSPRPSVPADVADILRSEAALEVETRAAEDAARRIAPIAPIATAAPAVAPLADQPAPEPPPLQDEVLRRVTPMREAVDASRPARTMRSEPQPAPEFDRAKPALRSTNDRPTSDWPTTARPTTARSAGGARPAPRRRSGVGAGPWAVLLVIAILALLYALRPQIVAAVPQAATVLDPYVQAMDQGRDWLNRQVRDLLTAIPPAENEAPTAE